MKLVRRGMASNPSEPGTATALRGPAMDTKFGRDVDPDLVRGAGGGGLDSAMDRYEVFHAKRPLRSVELSHDLPTSWICVGQAVSTMYRTDKWHEDGDDEDYKHVHDVHDGKEYEFGKGVLMYEPATQARKSKVEDESGRHVTANVENKPERLPVPHPKALTLLGYCLGIFVRRFDDEEIYELNPRGCYLFCSPSGDMLALYSPKKQPDGSSGFLCILAGGKLRVIEDGIDG